jgi:hypothetical protein
VSMRILSVIGGSLLTLLGLAKAAGLFHALAAGATGPAQFVVKQMVYTVALIVAGVAMLLAGRGRHDRPGAVDDPARAADSPHLNQDEP